MANGGRTTADSGPNSGTWWPNSGQVITEQRRKWGRTTDGGRMDKAKEWPKEGQTTEHRMGTETVDGQADKEGT